MSNPKHDACVKLTNIVDILLNSNLINQLYELPKVEVKNSILFMSALGTIITEVTNLMDDIETINKQSVGTYGETLNIVKGIVGFTYHNYLIKHKVLLDHAENKLFMHEYEEHALNLYRLFNLNTYPDKDSFIVGLVKYLHLDSRKRKDLAELNIYNNEDIAVKVDKDQLLATYNVLEEMNMLTLFNKIALNCIKSYYLNIGVSSYIGNILDIGDAKFNDVSKQVSVKSYGKIEMAVIEIFYHENIKFKDKIKAIEI